MSADRIALFVIRERFGRWEVDVPPGCVATIGFMAPFRTHEKALSYVRYCSQRFHASAPDEADEAET